MEIVLTFIDTCNWGKCLNSIAEIFMDQVAWKPEKLRYGMRKGLTFKLPDRAPL